MSFERFGRLGLLALLPAAALVYACSSDNNTVAGADAGTDSGHPTPTPQPTPNPTGDDDAATGDGGDAGKDASTIALGCNGNPLADSDAGGIVNDGGGLTAIATGRFLDGPQWIDDADGGGIIYSEVDSQNVVRRTATGANRVVLRSTGLENLPIGNGATNGFIYTALSRTTAGGSGGAILRMLVDGGDPQSFPAGEANSPNDLVASSKGIVYFTDPGYQTDGISTGVFSLSAAGTVSTITKFDGGTGSRADGIALSKDESKLFVAFFDEKKITKYTVSAAGVASDPVQVAVTLADNPTGLAIDAAGNLWVAESPSANAAAPGRVEVFSATGGKWGEIQFTDARPTGVAFGGSDNLTVFITTERGDVLDGTLYTMRTRCTGVR